MSAYDDGSAVEVEIEPEDPPSSGKWVDHEEFFEDPTDDELAEGERLGHEIDVDNDEDNGL
jgi:hypothetical protein